MADEDGNVIPAQAGIQRASRLAAFALAAFALAACSSKPSGDDWFPLAAGHAWTYRVTTLRDDVEPQRRLLTLYTRGAEVLGNATAFRRHADDGVDYWLRSDESGIYRVAMRNQLEREPRLDKERRYVLQKPYAVGTEWRASTTSYVMRRSNEVPHDVSRMYPSFPMTYRIDAVDETVETPAGRFEHCLRVKGLSEIKLYVDEVRTYRDVPLHTTEWYCRGVGLVRLERVEAAPSKLLVGGRVTLELAAWH